MLRPGRTTVGWYIVMRQRVGDDLAALGPFDRPTAEWYHRHDPGIRRPAYLVEAASADEAVAKARNASGAGLTPRSARQRPHRAGRSPH